MGFVGAVFVSACVILVSHPLLVVSVDVLTIFEGVSSLEDGLVGSRVISLPLVTLSLQ